MKTTHGTKRALGFSVLAMLLCVAMLAGTTFAWFTDTASTAVNKIQAGTLDIQLLDAADNSLEGQTLAWQKAAGAGAEEVLWEPGCTYNTQQFYIKNNGNLNLKFKFSVSGIMGDAKLLEVLDFTAMANASWFKFNTGAVSIATDGEFDLLKGYDVDTLFYGTMHFDEYVLEPGEKVGPIVISGHMEETAGNEYQNLSIDGIAITVVATQATGEEDSYNGVYDEDAEYPVVVADETTLRQALAEGKDVRLGSDIVLTSALTFNGDVDVIGDGNSIISSKEVYIAPTANVNFKNVNFANPVWDNNQASSVYASGLEGKVVFDGCTFTNPQWECIQITPKDGAEIIVTNCTFVVDGNGTYAHGTKVERMLHIQNTAASGKYTAVITNNNFVGVDLCRNAVIDVDDIEAFANVTCGGNTFANHDGTLVDTMVDGMIYVNINGLYDAANVATDTYAQFTQTPAAALHH